MSNRTPADYARERDEMNRRSDTAVNDFLRQRSNMSPSVPRSTPPTQSNPAPKK